MNDLDDMKSFIRIGVAAQQVVNKLLLNQHRVSGYKRVERDKYQTIEPWVTNALLGVQVFPMCIWEPACGDCHMVNALTARGKRVHASDIVLGSSARQDGVADFLATKEPPFSQRFAVISNPPFGERGKLATAFIEHAIELTKPKHGMLAMLLPADFDHASSRSHIFEHKAYAARVVLRSRPKWFAGGKTPKTNFVWHIWDWLNRHSPIVVYAGRDE